MEMFADITLLQWLNPILTLIYVATIVSCIVVVLSENRSPIRSIAWITVLIFLPVVGFIFYIFFGRSLKQVRMISRHKKRKLMSADHSTPPPAAVISHSQSSHLARLASTLSGSRLTVNNHITAYTDGASKFTDLKADLLAAKHSIYLQYYIFRDDHIGREIAEILKQKAREGVIVKVIYDHVGSFSVKSRFFTSMRKAGVQAFPFFRVSFPKLASRINWRNHRKIVIIDGVTAYIGGMNIADRYIYGPGKGRIWRDTHLRIRGDIAMQMLYSFAIDWNFMHQPLIHTQPASEPLPQNDVAIQLVTSGPTDTWSNIEMVFLRAIATAKRSVYIQTPYFLPTESLLRALQTAALSKIDVRVMVPRRSDSWMLRYASASYITMCLKAGIKFYFYEPGMLHSKNMIIDHDIVTTGSTNFDFRSFEHNFESNVIVYDRDFNARMREIFFDDLGQSTKVRLSEWVKRPVTQRLLESLLRLMSPIL